MNIKHKCPICGGVSFKLNEKIGGYFLYWCNNCDLRFTPDAFLSLPNYNEAYFTSAYIKNQIMPLEKSKNLSDISTCATYLYFFRHFKNVPKGLTLLDIGCGTGRFCHAAASKGFNVTGIDISDTAIKIGQKYARGFRLYCKSIDELILENKKYDIVTAFEVLEHLPDPVDFLKKVRMLLAEDGRAFFTVPNWDCTLVKNAKHYDGLPPYHILFFTRQAFYNLMAHAGFSRILIGVIKTDPFPDKLSKICFWVARRLYFKKRFELGLYAVIT